MKEDLLHNLEAILTRIKNACEKTGRNPSEVKLLLATKTVDPEKIKIALQAGQTLITENKIQEVKEKYEALKDTPHTSHFIGHLSDWGNVRLCRVLSDDLRQDIRFQRRVYRALPTYGRYRRI